MTEVRQGPTPRVRFREVSVKSELTVATYSVCFAPKKYFFIRHFYWTNCEGQLGKLCTKQSKHLSTRIFFFLFSLFLTVIFRCALDVHDFGRGPVFLLRNPCCRVQATSTPLRRSSSLAFTDSPDGCRRRLIADAGDQDYSSSEESSLSCALSLEDWDLVPGMSARKVKGQEFLRRLKISLSDTEQNETWVLILSCVKKKKKRPKILAFILARVLPRVCLSEALSVLMLFCALSNRWRPFSYFIIVFCLFTREKIGNWEKCTEYGKKRQSDR